MDAYYDHGGVTLYLGDCRAVLPQLDLQADCAVTDPPYGETSLAWDRWPDGWPTVVAEHTRSMWCFGSLRMFLDRRDEFAAWKLSQDVVWEKPRTRTVHADRFARVHEHALHWYRGQWSDMYHDPQRVPYYGKPVRANSRADIPADSRVHVIPGNRYEDDGTRLMKTVMQGAAGDPRLLLHPTQKPTTVLHSLISYACPSGGLVLDCFAGSGSTLVAARDSSRRAVGIEASERYCEVISCRLDQQAITYERGGVSDMTESSIHSD